MMDPNITQTTMRASARTGTPYVYASDVVGINSDIIKTCEKANKIYKQLIFK